MAEKKAMLGTPRVLHRPGTGLKTLEARFPGLHDTLEAISLFVFTPFFLFYGLVPVFGGDGLGLVGADEPRYAQIAREMLSRHDYVTPVLWGHPWLEKPALYYWRAMFAFLEFGVHDWSARLPSASFAFILVALIYLHMRRFRPGGQLDAALITASCAGIVGFARGASTDMQLAAPFCIGMLGWYAWYETDKKFWLFDLYFFVGVATLAKGPVAPFMALVIIFSFAALRREWSLLRRTIWIPGVLLYFAMVLPWYIAVQRRNPDFLRIFFLEHNLERFATNRYMHGQPFWYYIPVMLLALMPWSVIAMRALVEAIQQSIAEWRARFAKHHYVGHTAGATPFPNFWFCGPFSRSSFFPSPVPSCRATFCPRFRRSPFSPAITSTAFARKAWICGCCCCMPCSPRSPSSWCCCCRGISGIPGRGRPPVSCCRRFPAAWPPRCSSWSWSPALGSRAAPGHHGAAGHHAAVYLRGRARSLACRHSPLPRRTSVCWTLPTPPGHWLPSSARSRGRGRRRRVQSPARRRIRPLLLPQSPGRRL
jgi:hypothetical protein